MAGFGSFSIGTVLVGLAYLCLVLCLSEMTSALPVAGGSYGFARVMVGVRAGFLLGMSELLEYTMYVAATVLAFRQTITLATGLSANFEPLWWLLFFVVTLLLHLLGTIFLCAV